MPKKNDTPKPKLLPCPFCGGKPVVQAFSKPWRQHFVRCLVCGAHTSWSKYKKVAINRWNNRHG